MATLTPPPLSSSEKGSQGSWPGSWLASRFLLTVPATVLAGTVQNNVHVVRKAQETRLTSASNQHASGRRRCGFPRQNSAARAGALRARCPRIAGRSGLLALECVV